MWVLVYCSVCVEVKPSGPALTLTLIETKLSLIFVSVQQPSWPMSMAQSGVLLSPSPFSLKECWNYRYAVPHLAFCEFWGSELWFSCLWGTALPMEPSLSLWGFLLRSACAGAEKAVVVLNSSLESIYSKKSHGGCAHEQEHHFWSNKDCLLILSELKLSNKGKVV